MTSYEEFIAEKSKTIQPSGFKVKSSDIPSKAFPFQRDIIGWACRMGRAAIFADTGLGKTLQQLSWASAVARQSKSPVLILAPLAVGHQTVREAKHFDIPNVSFAASDADVGKKGIYVTNYQKLHKFDAKRFGGVVLDECFPAGTMIDTALGKKRIETVRVGDKILNASGIDTVSDVHRREVSYAVRITVCGSEKITTSPNHPVFTRRGWVGAQDLEPGDCVLQTREAVRILRGCVPASSVREFGADEVLREILLSELADASAAVHCQCSQSGGCCQAREVVESVLCGGKSQGRANAGEDCRVEPDGQSRDSGEGEPHIETHEAQTFRAWREWSGDDSPSDDPSGCSRDWVGSRVCLTVGDAKSGLSNSLQNRLSERRKENRDRGGWELPPGISSQGEGCEEGCDARFSRVDRVEILERGHPELERFRDADGKLYFYDLGATRHPSFSVEGFLVHNSSILKSHDGKTRNILIDTFAATEFKLCCTATPAPNDHTEIGNHAEFLGIMSRVEMLATYFVHDSGNTSEWRLKGHAERDFWRWVASWAMMLRRPSDLGYEDGGYDLPPLEIIEHRVECPAQDGVLFAVPEMTLEGQRKARRLTMDARVEKAAEIASVDPNEPCIVWVELNDEGDAAEEAIPNCVQIAGSDSDDDKEDRLIGFADGKYTKLVSKSSIAGFGMNFQRCAEMVFVGLTHSYESYFQSIRRCWRFGQTRPVRVHVVTSDLESAVLENIKAKQAAHEEQFMGMLEHTRDVNRAALGATTKTQDTYATDTVQEGPWTIHLGDCVEGVRKIEDNSIHYSVFSPPFASLYTYSASSRDMGNCKDDDSFFQHFGYLVKELYRVLMPGRLVSFHCMNLPTSKERDGYIGIRDFRGDLIRLFQSEGFIFHSEVCIWKDPVTAMQRTKALGLLHKQIKKDSCMSRQGIPDYVVTMRKPGVNPEPVSGRFEEFYGTDGPPPQSVAEEGFHGNKTPDAASDRYSIEVWQRYASPVWMDINQSNTLNNFRDGREHSDERHICLATGSLVLTRENGYLEIEDVEVGDHVLTHKGRWMPVLAKKCNGIAETIRVCGQGVADLRLTPDHKLWTRVAYGAKAKENARRHPPSWVDAKETLGSYLNMPLPPEEDSELTDHEWWIVGRWLGDGHRGSRRTSGKRGGGLGQFIISCNHNEAADLREKLGVHAGSDHIVSATQINLINLRPEVRDVLGRCGEGAENKRMPGEAFCLNAAKSESLLSGYLSADGHYVEKHDRVMASSISRGLLLGMSILAQRARGVVASVYAGRPEREGEILGRQVSMSQDWVLAFRNSDGYRKSGWIDEFGAWKKVRKIEENDECQVWDLQVQEDASFAAEGCIVHNCPLQLDVVSRCLDLWSNPGDLVLSPFCGIGSEGHESVRMGRRFVGFELKRSYFDIACTNLRAAVEKCGEKDLFSDMELEDATA